MEVHEKIRFLRESKNWSQEEMAEKLNMSLSGYSKIEHGDTKVSIPKLKKIAGIFETDLIELMLLGENPIYLSGIDAHNNNHGCYIIGSTELAFENQKLQLIIDHLKAILEQKNIEIAHQKEIIELLKNDRDYP
jgi:transcriptional regulator with XRE-family HTH domain